VDVNPDNLAAARELANLPEEKCFDSLEAALKNVEADAVLSVTPPAVHVQHARLSFGKGLHFMCEKPLADTVEHAREMLELARQSGKQLAVSQQYRFNPTIQHLKHLLAENAVGEFGHGHLDFYIPADFTGTFRETMEYPLLLDMTIHHFDLIRCITGRDITKVLAWSFRPAWSWYQHDPGLKMLLELEGGLPFSYSGDWSGRGKSTSWSGDWRLQCSEGALLFEYNEIFVARSERWGREQTVEPAIAPGIEREAQTATLHLFAQAIRSGQPNEISGVNNFASFAAVQAGIESAELGKAVEVASIN
jgi:predicted dehydrogenase